MLHLDKPDPVETVVSDMTIDAWGFFSPSRPVGCTHVRLCTRMHVRIHGTVPPLAVALPLPAPPFAATEPCFGFVPDGTCFMQLLVATRRRPFSCLHARRRSQQSPIGREHHDPLLDGQPHVRAV